jgi:DNA-binding CsgD family transcriptional regulator
VDRQLSYGKTLMAGKILHLTGYVGYRTRSHAGIRSVVSTMPRSEDDGLDLGEHRLVFGIVLVDRDGTVLVSNQPATSILEEGTAIAIVDGRLVAVHPGEQARLRMLVAGVAQSEPGATASAGGVMSIARGRRVPLSLLVAPLVGAGVSRTPDQPAAVLFVVDPEQPGQRWRKYLEDFYGLTRAEADVAVLLLQGIGVSDIARRRRTSFNTARTHLKRVFDKLGVHSQAELVRLLLSGGPPRDASRASPDRGRRAG